MDISGQKNPKSKAIYDEANKRIEKWTATCKFILIDLTVYPVTAINFVMAMYTYATVGLAGYDYNFTLPLW